MFQDRLPFIIIKRLPRYGKAGRGNQTIHFSFYQIKRGSKAKFRCEDMAAYQRYAANMASNGSASHPINTCGKMSNLQEFAKRKSRMIYGV